ncbi:hypothetical protein AZI86_02385 [Bdellovibrio bacteriovorus]|uniref:Cation:proton antiporter n=1 Tax=Bdellovibrio bacteriovorus TaxID=959 RepID=A0A150WNR9_BDEBC|nr:monovalent cation/H(+) antiporter subunit G [Bdellovibrio bacteriovorus]KYG65939.1 hypothetical protein AZI86_02385 [Bdellovibrio bacteriovorus]
MNPLTLILFLIGVILTLLAAVGSLKFPDTLTRMAAVTKASTAGVVFFCLAAISHFQDLESSLMLAAAAAILCMGIPISSYLIGRARVRMDKAKHPLVLKRDDLSVD